MLSPQAPGHSQAGARGFNAAGIGSDARRRALSTTRPTDAPRKASTAVTADVRRAERRELGQPFVGWGAPGSLSHTPRSCTAPPQGCIYIYMQPLTLASKQMKEKNKIAIGTAGVEDQSAASREPMGPDPPPPTAHTLGVLQHTPPPAKAVLSGSLMCHVYTCLQPCISAYVLVTLHHLPHINDRGSQSFQRTSFSG